MRHELMHTPLAIDTATAQDLEALLDLLGISVLADTIKQYWSPTDRLEAFYWASATIAARRNNNVTAPPIPEVLQDFCDASAKVEA